MTIFSQVNIQNHPRRVCKSNYKNKQMIPANQLSQANFQRPHLTNFTIPHPNQYLEQSPNHEPQTDFFLPNNLDLPTVENPILNIQAHIKVLNAAVDSRISTLRTKIDKLKQELLELDKLNPNYGNVAHLQSQVKLGGKIHTQIVIDAVQSPNQSVIKVNQIKKKFIGYVDPPAARPPPNYTESKMKSDPTQNDNSIKQEDPYAIGQLPNYINSLKTEGTPRNKYRMLATDLKRKAVHLAQEKGPRYSSLFYQVPLKSLKRWIKVGCERKKGGGRKTKDPQMERTLYKWYKNETKEGRTVTARKVKDMAIKMSTCGDFIASKGWLDKFKVRYRLDIHKEQVGQSFGAQSSVSGSGLGSRVKDDMSSEEPPEETGDSYSDMNESEDVNMSDSDDNDLVDSDDRVQQSPVKSSIVKKGDGKSQVSPKIETK